MIKLNLGCWKRNLPGFINIDIRGYPHVHFKRSIEDLSIFEDNSVDLIYASHVFPYFSFNQAHAVLREWNRVLKPGGVLKLAVPDFEGITKAYQKYGDIFQFMGAIYGFLQDGPKMVDGKPIQFKMIYDMKVLTRLLEETGFTSVRRYDWRDFLPKGAVDHSMAYVPGRDYENGVLVSLNVEAKKAGTTTTLLNHAKYLADDAGAKVSGKAQRVLRGEILKKKDPYKI